MPKQKEITYKELVKLGPAPPCKKFDVVATKRDGHTHTHTGQSYSVAILFFHLYCVDILKGKVVKVEMTGCITREQVGVMVTPFEF